MQIKVGKYTGTGVQQGITGIGFKPGVVILQREAAASTYPMIRFDGWAANYSQSLDGIQQPASGILSCDADGFTVGTDVKVNASGGTYHYLCIADNGGGDAVIGSYVGNGSSPRNITTGFAPQFVLAGQSGGSFCWKITGMASANDLEFGYNNPDATRITAVGAMPSPSV